MITIKIFWFVLIIVFSVVIGDLIILWFMARGKSGSDYIYTEKEMEDERWRRNHWKTMYRDEKNKNNEELQRKVEKVSREYEKTILLLKQSYENKLKKVKA